MTTTDASAVRLWFKIVGMLQQNWAVYERGSTGQPRISFVEDDGVIFDEIPVPSEWRAHQLLRFNGFRLWEDDEESQAFLTPPAPPFQHDPVRRRPIYSSGEYWKPI